MAFEEMERKMKNLYENVKSGKVTKEIEEEFKELVDKIEDMCEEAKEKLSNMVSDVKDAMKRNK